MAPVPLDLADPLLRALAFAAPIMAAALGETIVERSGRVNLGVEGLMALGAAVGALVGAATGSLLAMFAAASAASALLAVVYVVLVEKIGADQIVVGLGLVFLGLGLAEAVGSNIAEPAPSMPTIAYRLDAFQALVVAATAAAWLLLYKTWLGYELRSLGENPEAAVMLGSRRWLSSLAVIVEGALTGAAGAYLVAGLHYGKWFSGITQGWGWIAIGMVILGYWNPATVALASYAMGLLYVVEPMLRGVPPALARSIPYLAVLAALALVSVAARRAGKRPPQTIWLQLL